MDLAGGGDSRQDTGYRTGKPARGRRRKTHEARAASNFLALPALPTNPDSQLGQAARRVSILAQMRILQQQLQLTNVEPARRGFSLPSPPWAQAPSANQGPVSLANGCPSGRHHAATTPLWRISLPATSIVVAGCWLKCAVDVGVVVVDRNVMCGVWSVNCWRRCIDVGVML